MLKLILIILLTIIPLSYSRIVEFGLKLKLYAGYQDFVVFGFVDLRTFAGSEEFKEIMRECLQDYLNSEARQNVTDKSKMNGIVEKVQLPLKEDEELKFKVSGDVYNFQLFLMTMIFSYYRGTMFKIQFIDLPIIKTSRKRPAKIGEIILLDLESVYTGYDDDVLLNFLVNNAGSRDGSDSNGTNPDSRTSLLPKTKRQSKERIKLKEVDCGCNHCCTIS